MNNLRLSLLVFGSFLIFGGPAAGRGDIERQADDLVKDWRSIRSDFVDEAKNEEVLAVLRKRARIAGEERARVLLLKVGDPETVTKRLAEFEAEPRDRGQDISLSGNPRLILELASALFKEETVTNQKVAAGEESVRILPLSARAAMTIRSLIVTSTVFDPSVENWAKKLQQIGIKNIEQTRASIRAWVKMNRGVLESGRYAAAEVPGLEQKPR